jgi:hypothetical protein
MFYLPPPKDHVVRLNIEFCVRLLIISLIHEYPLRLVISNPGVMYLKWKLLRSAICLFNLMLIEYRLVCP